MIDENIKNAWDKINPSEAEKQRIMGKIYEAENQSNRKVGIRSVLIAAVIAVLAMTTAFAAPVWRYLETRIIQGSVYTHSGHFIVREYDGERVFDISGIPEVGAAPTVVEVDGDRLTLYDPRNFFSNTDLDENSVWEAP